MYWLGLSIAVLASCHPAPPHSPVHSQLAEAHLRFRLIRTPCLGRCPSYELNVSDDGTLEYIGHSDVIVIGRRTRKLSATTLAAIDHAFDQAGFEEISPYGPLLMDVPDIVMWRRGPLGLHIVTETHGRGDESLRLSALANELDRLFEARLWVGKRAQQFARQLATGTPHREPPSSHDEPNMFRTSAKLVGTCAVGTDCSIVLTVETLGDYELPALGQHDDGRARWSYHFEPAPANDVEIVGVDPRSHAVKPRGANLVVTGTRTAILTIHVRRRAAATLVRGTLGFVLCSQKSCSAYERAIEVPIVSAADQNLPSSGVTTMPR